MKQALASNHQSYLLDLNPEQMDAVCYTGGPLLVFAGAGSGKTRVLTRRIAFLVRECGVFPNNIFAVTFTNKAALEMKQRVVSLFERKSTPLWVATFHSACLKILRAHSEDLGFTSQFAVYDSSDSASAIKRVYKRQNVDPKCICHKMVLSRIDKAKNSYLSPDDMRKEIYPNDSMGFLFADLYEGYQKELRESNAMDFGDLLCNTLTLFSTQASVKSYYQSQFEHIMVDEYQDTNKVQYLLLKALTENNKNICVVGDDDQSIYAFRGATIENILSFKKDFPDAKVVTLTTNYRSTKNILLAASKVIEQNNLRQDKNLKTTNPKGSPIIAFQGYNEWDEAEFVVQEITALEQRGESLSNIAVFYRMNAQSRAIEEALCASGIRYEIYGGFKFYDRKEVKDILAYFKLLLNPQDNESLLRIINSPARGIGSTSIGNLIGYAQQHELALLPALRQAVKDRSSFARGAGIQKKLTSFIDLIDDLQKTADAAARMLANPSDNNYMAISQAIPDLLKAIADKSQYLLALKKEDSAESEDRIGNIHELLSVSEDFAKKKLNNGDILTLSDFLDRASLASDLDKDEKNMSGEQVHKEHVSLMTFHLAKGLEFSSVFMVGMEEGIIPHVRSLGDQRDVEEERRLCYVGITRAKNKLYLSQCLTRHGFGGNSNYSGMPSRFLRSIPKDIVDLKHRWE